MQKVNGFEHFNRRRKRLAMMRRSAVAVGLAFGLNAMPALAGDPSQWRGELTIYGWVPSFGGEIGDASGSLDFDLVELDSESILQQTDMAFFGTAKARRGDLFAFGDLVYANLSDKGTTRGPIADSVKVKVKATSAMAGAGYTFAHWEGGHADAMLGARYVSIDSTLSVSRASTISASGSIDWFEPALGLGARHRLAEDWYLEGSAYFGGFGLGSEFTSDVYAAIGYDLAEWASVILGYRWLSIDYDDEIPMDVDLYGPLLGASFRY